jgi:hypothetical protein
MSGEGMKTELDAPGLRVFAKVLGPDQGMVLTINGERWVMVRETQFDKIISGKYDVKTDKANSSTST